MPRLLLEPQRKGRVKVVLGVGPERYVGGGVDHGRNFREPVGNDIRKVFMPGNPGDGDQVPLAGDGVHLADAFDR